LHLDFELVLRPRIESTPVTGKVRAKTPFSWGLFGATFDFGFWSRLSTSEELMKVQNLICLRRLLHFAD
jgi:hypothetical protein